MEPPKISIVTPSFNQGEYIEETICSVLDQNYPNLEYIIIDGGSTDNSLEIINKYKKHLAYFQSEPDHGQVDALQKGFNRSTGEIMAWLNSDDLYYHGTLEKIANRYRDEKPQWWTGFATEIWENNGINSYRRWFPGNAGSIHYNELLYVKMIIAQVSTFWTRSLWQQIHGKLRSCHYAFDYNLWLDFASITKGTVINDYLGLLRFHDKSKTGELNGMDNYLGEASKIRKERILSDGRSIIPLKARIQFWARYSSIRRGDYRAIVGNRRVKELYL